MNRSTGASALSSRDPDPKVAWLSSHSAYGRSRTVVANNTNQWSRTIGTRLNELTSLPVGWDGYLAPPVVFTNARFAADLLEEIFQYGVPCPSIVPGSDGTLQIEWHVNGYDIELDVLGENHVVAWRRNIRTQNDEEVTLTTADFSVVAGWISDLMSAARGNDLAAAI